ncbi:hypothetical protein RHMOL_Rhmol01G0222300 [Rhododendron molle]|uniref:Uncharacterized protein n=1 Tax=Rhododendron molle TaxID=49168 RepID=A0ACC0Q5T5_RHOML|nr:hypothetical protein RHMOL_Rhmol01G0222300 [Rhododendron molle]
MSPSSSIETGSALPCHRHPVPRSSTYHAGLVGMGCQRGGGPSSSSISFSFSISSQTKRGDITVISAKNLKVVNLISKMDLYVVISIADDPTTKCRTRVVKDGKKSPKWNDSLNFAVDAATRDRFRKSQ